MDGIMAQQENNASYRNIPFSPPDISEAARDIIEWDSVNWAKFLDFIDGSGIDLQGKRVLALGERNGGMSLFFALRGAEVLCSDLNGPTEKARTLHERYGISSRVQYAAVDGVSIPEEYTGQFDIVTFKSVLGGIGRDDSYARQGMCAESVYRVLRPKGYAMFAENMRGTWWHMLLRKAFRPTGGTGTLRHIGSLWPYSGNRAH